MTFDLLDANTYVQRLANHISQAKKRIVIASMAVLWGDKTGTLFAEIDKALARGVNVHILLDAYTRTGLGFNGTKQLFRQRLQKTEAIFKDIQKKGARVDLVGKIGINPFKGRCHVKITVVDDDCFSFGGINFVDQAFVNHDYMLHTHNADLADCLAQLVGRIGRAKLPLPDAEVPLGSHSSILFDGGKPKHSIIYERATILARQAERVWFVSQMAPSGPLAHALKAANATCYFNRPEQVTHTIASWALAFDQQRYRIVNHYYGHDYIHAKFILFELYDGSKALITGSNNFSYRGVAFGTQEIALYSTDKQLWQQLVDFTNKHISRP